VGLLLLLLQPLLEALLLWMLGPSLHLTLLLLPRLPPRRPDNAFLLSACAAWLPAGPSRCLSAPAWVQAWAWAALPLLCRSPDHAAPMLLLVLLLLLFWVRCCCAAPRGDEAWASQVPACHVVHT
jgi:hypothetical protein